MSGFDSNDDDLVLLICVMDSYVQKMRRRSRIPKHVSAFSSHQRMSELISGHKGLLLEQIRMNMDCFNRLCTLFMFQNRVHEMHTLTVQKQLKMFLTMVAHCDSNRRSAYEWNHLRETISRYFDVVCLHLVNLATRFIVLPDFNVVSLVIATNRKFYPYFWVRF